MTQEHKHYAEALILASKIYAEFERTSTTTRYKVDENRVLYSLEEFRGVFQLYLEKGNRATFAKILLSHRPKRGTDEMRISAAFKLYLDMSCHSRGKMKNLLRVLPSYRQVAITDILATLD